MTTNEPQNPIREPQFYNIELPSLPIKTTVQKSPAKPSVTVTNPPLNIPKENSINVSTCNLIYNINANKNGFESSKTESITTDFTNVLKNNVSSNQTMMLIDVDQLVESGGLESEVSKLREALLRPLERKRNYTKPFKDKSDDTGKTYTCQVCSKTFKRREHLYQHSKLHSGLRPFSCVHCPKTFSRKEHLMRHLTSHSGAKDFGCDICNKRFSRPDNLKKHKRTHQKSPYRCAVCCKNFIIKHYYVAHMQAHQNGENILDIMKVENSVDL